MKQRIEFLRESLRNIRSTGSVAPSSRFLCRAIVDKINPELAGIVVELGPGDGVITRYILDRLKPDARLIIFEINETFVARIKRHFSDPRLLVIHDSAENMEFHFKRLGIECVHYIISGIPFAMLPETLATNITKQCLHVLEVHGKFIQFHYVPFMLQFYKKFFGNASVEVVPLNIPPALVICCEKRLKPAYGPQPDTLPSHIRPE